MQSLLLVAALSATVHAAEVPCYKTVVVFGDSLSDNFFRAKP
jgi:phospholipase/lecithinase/hemolysin